MVATTVSPRVRSSAKKSQRLAIPLEPGFVHTVEPGIYSIPELIDLWKGEKKFKDFINYDKVEEYRNFGGIRNEEDYLITETGARRLGKKIPVDTGRGGSVEIIASWELRVGCAIMLHGNSQLPTFNCLSV